MTPETLTGVVHRLRVVVDPATPARPDADLVRLVARHRDSAAFADVVRRHGPMVLGACRRVLRDHADADDAFQATFLVFLRRAAALRNPERLAGWLFQVAYRTSQKLRAARLARRARETELFDLPGGEPPAEFVWRELRPIFDAELDRLPDKLRLPAVLCLLEGRSKRDAAKTLGWPEGTVAGRLQLARETLRRRFTARGLTLSAGALAVALFEGAGAAAVPPALFASTIQSVAMGSASAGAAALADGVVHAMFLTKVKVVTAAVLLMGVVGTGTGVVLTPGAGPGAVLAQGPGKEKGPTRDELTKRIDNLRQLEERYRPLLDRGVIAKSDYDRLTADLARARAELAKPDPPPPPGDPKFQREAEELASRFLLRAFELAGEIEQLQRKGRTGKLSAAEAERLADLKKERDALDRLARPLTEAAARREQLTKTVEQLRERQAWAERAVAKGYAVQGDLDKVLEDLVRANTLLKELDAPPTVDAKRAKLEERVRELAEAEKEAVRGFQAKVVSQSEVLRAQVQLMRARFELLRLDAGSDPKAAEQARELKKDLLALQEKILQGAELSFQQKVISAVEVRQTRAAVAATKAELADATGVYDEAVRDREEAVKELEALLDMAKAGAAADRVGLAELRQYRRELAEAKANLHRSALRKELAEVVTLRAEELEQVKKLVAAKAVSVDEVRAAERALAEAKAKLAEGR